MPSPVIPNPQPGAHAMSILQTSELIVPSVQDLSTDEDLTVSDSDATVHPGPKADRSPVAGLKRTVELHQAAANRHLGAAVMHWFLEGDALNRAKERMGRSQWLQFLRGAFGEGKSPVSIRSCQRYMRLAKHISVIAARRGITINATRVSPSEAEHILDGLSLRAALQLTSTHHDVNVEDLEDELENDESPDDRPREESSPDEWLTPESLIGPILTLWPHIDLDPCSEGGQQPNIPARLHYTREDNGLSPNLPWRGTAFINPGQAGDLRPWVARSVVEFQAGHVREAILLLPAATDAHWADLIQPFPRAFLHSRPNVPLAHEPEMQIVLPQPAMLIFLGDSERLNDFAEHFGVCADVFQAYSYPNSAT